MALCQSAVLRWRAVTISANGEGGSVVGSSEGAGGPSERRASRRRLRRARIRNKGTLGIRGGEKKQGSGASWFGRSVPKRGLCGSGSLGAAARVGRAAQSPGGKRRDHFRMVGREQTDFILSSVE
jgi:hypothetical protein